MKICFLNHTLDEATGAGRFARSLLTVLRRVHPEIDYTVLTIIPTGASDELAIIPVTKWDLPLALPRIRAVFRHYDIVHALDGYPLGVIAALARLGLRPKLVVTAIGTGALQPFDRLFAGSALHWAYRQADAVTAVSRFTARELRAWVPRLRVRVVNHGVEVAEFADRAMGSLPSEEAAVINGLKPYVFTLGAFKPRKGYRYSLRAFAEVRRDVPNLRYVIVGSGDQREIAPDIGALNLEGAVTLFTGVSRRFLIALYQEAELFVLLPQNDRGDVEGFGLAFLEAAAAGLPVVGAGGSGAEDGISAGENGIVVPPGDHILAASAMRRILSEASLRAELSQGSLAFARRKSWEVTLEQYLVVYRSVLATNA